jgi:hypothetical protein
MYSVASVEFGDVASLGLLSAVARVAFWAALVAWAVVAVAGDSLA